MLFTFIACSKSKSETENQSAPQDPTQVVQLEVVGMTCTGCEVTVKKALTKIDGVYEAKASYQTNSAEVTIDPTKVDEQKLIEAVNQTGYKASRKPS
jgi:mercuric ion binding protein